MEGTPHDHGKGTGRCSRLGAGHPGWAPRAFGTLGLPPRGRLISKWATSGNVDVHAPGAFDLPRRYHAVDCGGTGGSGGRGEWSFAIRHLATNRGIGSTRYWKLLFHATGAVEIGYTWLTPASWRTAVNTESKYLLLRQAFEGLGVLRVQLMTDARNIRSQRAIERLGAVKEGMLRCHRIPPDGYRRSSVVYSIIDEEWPQVKVRLEASLTRA